MKKIGWIAILLLISTVSAQPGTREGSISECLFDTKSCDNCLHIKVNIEKFSNEEENIVGDDFYYTINVTNIGNQSINNTLRVTVFNPSRDIIGVIREYPLLLLPNESSNLKYNYTRGIKDDMTDIYAFDTAGAYKIQVIPEKPLEFISFRESCAMKQYPDEYTLYFDAMPKWQRDWQNQSLNLTVGLISISNRIASSVDDVQDGVNPCFYAIS